MLALYAREGYLNAQVDFSVVELPKRGDDEQVKLLYTIANEGDKVYVNRILVNGVTGSPKNYADQASGNPASNSACRE